MVSSPIRTNFGVAAVCQIFILIPDSVDFIIFTEFYEVGFFTVQSAIFNCLPS